jgi:competence protein ComEA
MRLRPGTVRVLTGFLTLACAFSLIKSFTVRPVSVRAASPEAALISLHQATARDWFSLPGIGIVIAERIIAKKKVNQGFYRIEDLLQVKGIGRRKLERLRPWIDLKNKED